MNKYIVIDCCEPNVQIFPIDYDYTKSPLFERCAYVYRVHTEENTVYGGLDMIIDEVLFSR